MKTKTIILSVLMIFIGLGALAQDQNSKNYLFTLKGKNKTHEIGWYGSLSGMYSNTMSEPSGWLGSKVGVVFNHKWAFGWAGNALYFDRKLDELVTDGTYHLQAGYAGAFAEYMMPIGNRVKLNFSIVSGQGIAFFQYDKDFAENRPWYEEKIDQETFAVFEPGIELMTKIGNRWWFGINGSYRNTSPVKLNGTNDLLFNKFNGGLSVRYGIF